MKLETKNRRPVVGGMILLLSLWAWCVPAQTDYSIDWYAIDGGGGTSTGGVYALTGTIGQSDAGNTTLTGGPYSLTGGFWVILDVVQTPGAPLLALVRSNQTVIVFWPLPAEGWVLKWTDTLEAVSAAWLQISPPYQTNGANRQVIEPLSAGNRFYRLHRP